jgi:hypothetical protein
MNLVLRELPSAPSDLAESDIRVCADDFRQMTGYPASRFRLQPWKTHVVTVTSRVGTVWRLLKGHGNLPARKDECWLGPGTRSQLNILDGSGLSVTVAKSQVLGRLRPSDAVRIAFRAAIGCLAVVTTSALLHRRA